MTTTKKIDIRRWSFDKIEKFFIDKGEKSFRAKQVYEWIWKKSARSFDEMTNVSVSIRNMLKEHFMINAIKFNSFEISED